MSVFLEPASADEPKRFLKNEAIKVFDLMQILNELKAAEWFDEETSHGWNAAIEEIEERLKGKTVLLPSS